MIDRIGQLIDKKLEGINTVALGIITQVDLPKMRCNVKLKHKIQGNEIELFDVPVAVPKFHDSCIILAPKEGDIVLVLFSKYELEEQLKNKQAVAVNELLKFNINNAIVVAGMFTLVDTVPAELDEESVLIKHKQGSYVKIDSQGNIEVKHMGGNNITVSATQIVLKASQVVVDGNLFVNGDLDFVTIVGTDKSAGSWHPPGV